MMSFIRRCVPAAAVGAFIGGVVLSAAPGSGSTV